MKARQGFRHGNGTAKSPGHCRITTLRILLLLICALLIPQAADADRMGSPERWSFLAQAIIDTREEKVHTENLQTMAEAELDEPCERDVENYSEWPDSYRFGRSRGESALKLLAIRGDRVPLSFFRAFEGQCPLRELFGKLGLAARGDEEARLYLVEFVDSDAPLKDRIELADGLQAIGENAGFRLLHQTLLDESVDKDERETSSSKIRYFVDDEDFQPNLEPWGADLILELLSRESPVAHWCALSLCSAFPACSTDQRIESKVIEISNEDPPLRVRRASEHFLSSLGYRRRFNEELKSRSKASAEKLPEVDTPEAFYIPDPLLTWNHATRELFSLGNHSGSSRGLLVTIRRCHFSLEEKQLSLTILALRGDRVANSHFTKLLNHEDPWMRLLSRLGLAVRGHQESTDFLLRAIDSPDHPLDRRIELAGLLTSLQIFEGEGLLRKIALDAEAPEARRISALQELERFARHPAYELEGSGLDAMVFQVFEKANPSIRQSAARLCSALGERCTHSPQLPDGLSDFLASPDPETSGSCPEENCSEGSS